MHDENARYGAQREKHPGPPVKEPPPERKPRDPDIRDPVPAEPPVTDPPAPGRPTNPIKEPRR